MLHIGRIETAEIIAIGIREIRGVGDRWRLSHTALAQRGRRRAYAKEAADLPDNAIGITGEMLGTEQEELIAWEKAIEPFQLRTVEAPLHIAEDTLIARSLASRSSILLAREMGYHTVESLTAATNHL